ncbi:hypothetical protein [Hymenobacter sp. IS2118]|uniref:hypothetical protein n=1 Tax=Hymenobacter sp. IS2118 TaxID=1505605 RepID=UPI001268A764|nr:hypothetical protein [Hymenobacter sp. IS2118]
MLWLQLRSNARRQKFIHTIRLYNQLLRAGQEADLPYARVHFPPGSGFLGQRFVNPSLQDPFERWQEELSTAEIPDQDWVMATANPFYNAYVAAYFQQQKRVQRAMVALMAVAVLTIYFAQE